MAGASQPLYPRPVDEERRLRLLADPDLDGAVPGREYDQLTELAADLLGFPVCLVTIVGRDEQSFKSRWGTDLERSPREGAFCAHTICQDGAFVVADAANDPRFRESPIVREGPRFGFYAGAPIHAGDRLPLGALCVLDYRPRTLDEGQQALLVRLAAIVSERIESRHQQRRAQRIVAEALHAAETARADLAARAANDAAIRAQVDTIVSGIERLASRLRVLALNASIEAARSGDAGRGTAVVAGEVRRLAEDARDATTKVRALLN